MTVSAHIVFTRIISIGTSFSENNQTHQVRGRTKHVPVKRWQKWELIAVIVKENFVDNEVTDGYEEEEGKSSITNRFEYEVLWPFEPVSQRQKKQYTANQHYYSHVKVGNIEVAVHAIVKSRKYTSRNENINSSIVQSDRNVVGSGRHGIE